MSSPLVHGCYDQETLQTLLDLGIRDFAFDLRGRSPNLIPFSQLSLLLKKLPSNENIYVTFENDKKETVLSYLNLLKNEPFRFTALFRGQETAEFLYALNVPFVWMFRPGNEWERILELPQIKGVLLPLRWRDYYQTLPEFWKMIDAKNLDVYLHADHFQETSELNLRGVKVSLDLSREVETHYRHVDQNKLKMMNIWRKLNENPHQ